jgi:hypothetical protein
MSFAARLSNIPPGLSGILHQSDKALKPGPAAWLEHSPAPKHDFLKTDTVPVADIEKEDLRSQSTTAKEVGRKLKRKKPAAKKRNTAPSSERLLKQLISQIRRKQAVASLSNKTKNKKKRRN